MDSERYLVLRRLFDEVRQLAPEDREAFLERECADDPDLRREVEGLLANDRTGPGAMNALEARVVAAVQGLDPTRDAVLPERIGRYRILEVLGEGGMGIVYRAEQTEPIRREVALKLTRERLHDAGIAARFESERQTLARMDHPNIARVLEAGADDAGRPYFVMELVRGMPITKYCVDHALDVRHRMELVLDVARAVRHAHRKGIIHRDLKPSNILVTESGGRPLPKVIDFSIAKALDVPLVDTAFRTRTGQLVGTLEYMSPEQARGDVAAIDVRTDVYALGAIAYELLTGRLPHEVRDLPLHEAVRRIVEEPPIPMRRQGTTNAGRRHVDLETIVHKCLAADPDQRYSGADELVEDLERFLDARPIQARRPTALYLLRTVIRRHRVAVGVLGLVLTLLIAFSVTVALQAAEQARQRKRAEAAADQSQAVLTFVQQWLGAANANKAGYDATIVEALEYVVPNVEQELADQPLVAAAVFETVGVVYRMLERLDEAERPLLRSLELRLQHLGRAHADTAHTYLEIANLQFFRRRLKDCIDATQTAIAIYEALDPVDEVQLAQALNTLGLAYRETNDFVAAEAALRRSIRLLESLGREFLDDLATSRESLAGVYLALGRLDEAEAEMVAVVEGKRSLSENGIDTGVATALYNLSAIYERRGRYAEAERAVRECLAIEEALYPPESPAVAVTMAGLAAVLAVQEEWDEAERLATTALERLRSGGAPYHTRCAAALTVIARARLARGDIDAAVRSAQEAVELALAAAGEDHLFTARTRLIQFQILDSARQRDRALETGRAALAAFKKRLPPDHAEITTLEARLSRMEARDGAE